MLFSYFMVIGEFFKSINRNKKLTFLVILLGLVTQQQTERIFFFVYFGLVLYPKG